MITTADDAYMFELTSHVEHGDSEFLPGPSVFCPMHLRDDLFQFIQAGGDQ